MDKRLDSSPVKSVPSAGYRAVWWVLFFLLLTPVSLMIRFIYKKRFSFKVGFDSSLDSYWVEKRSCNTNPDYWKQQY